MNQEVTASNSHAVLISELTEMRDQLWQVIAAGKKAMPFLPEKNRPALLAALMEAEAKLK